MITVEKLEPKPIEVVGLVEALPECGGYKVHKDKLVRMGVPIHTRHTVISANGADHVESVTIAEIDDNWQVIPGTEKSFACDTLLIAVVAAAERYDGFPMHEDGIGMARTFELEFEGLGASLRTLVDQGVVGP